MQFVEMGDPAGKTLMLLPGTACDYQTNYAAVLDRLGRSRLCLFHENKPGMLNAFLEIIAQNGVNVEHMLNKARGNVAYTIFDTDQVLDEAMADRMRAINGVVRVRLLR